VSIDYSLEIATGTPVAQVAEAVRQVAESSGLLAGSVSAERLLVGVLLGRGPWIRVLEPSIAPWQAVVTDLDITPTVRIAFRLMKESAGLSTQEDALVGVAVGLLDVVPGDAVLHREHESIWLLRLGGALSLHESDEVWTPGRLAIVGLRFHRRRTRTFAD
jgi:hypothetical protein